MGCLFGQIKKLSQELDLYRKVWYYGRIFLLKITLPKRSIKFYYVFNRNGEIPLEMRTLTEMIRLSAWKLKI